MCFIGGGLWHHQGSDWVLPLFLWRSAISNAIQIEAQAGAHWPCSALKESCRPPPPLLPGLPEVQVRVFMGGSGSDRDLISCCLHSNIFMSDTCTPHAASRPSPVGLYEGCVFPHQETWGATPVPAGSGLCKCPLQFDSIENPIYYICVLEM